MTHHWPVRSSAFEYRQRDKLSKVHLEASQAPRANLDKLFALVSARNLTIRAAVPAGARAAARPPRPAVHLKTRLAVNSFTESVVVPNKILAIRELYGNVFNVPHRITNVDPVSDRRPLECSIALGGPSKVSCTDERLLNKVLEVKRLIAGRQFPPRFWRRARMV
ncbi:hypothetical protein EVAR_56000_1 [Eumeta japonica]|uniref:Uncharacterized protein n=1 Tax=Eumeta variegata TaxID=151549 RepID=A0A4C1YUE9_EUMVA|nr:hypothetical protein EVAR_56000_1 [Eumeta japonica]